MRTPIRFCTALAAGLVLAGALPASSTPKGAPKDPKPAAHRSGGPHTLRQEDDGETKFKQNCSRCHEAPQGFSPRISGTILRHMRVRASLSAEDEREILHFLNP